MATVTVQLPRNLTPLTRLQIDWEVDGSSGSTICEAWRVQHEIDRLQAAGYTVLEVTRHV